MGPTFVSVVVERMYDWSGSVSTTSDASTRFQLLLKGCTIEATLTARNLKFSKFVSVVVERMYDWSLRFLITIHLLQHGFSCCWKDVRLKLDGLIRDYTVDILFQLLLKGCTIEAARTCWRRLPSGVSVVVERMYDWSQNGVFCGSLSHKSFSCCWKDVRLKLPVSAARVVHSTIRFSCCWKDVRLKPTHRPTAARQGEVSVVVERMYDWSSRQNFWFSLDLSFQLLLKGCTIEAQLAQSLFRDFSVSVVVERMYDWSSETNWLKTNDFWQLVSDLFFENGRSAQKVPLFSKIWGDLGDCLTVFDSCSNI